MVSDQPVIGQMMDIFADRGEPVIGVQQVSEELVYRYGIVKYCSQEGRIYHIEDLVEKPDIILKTWWRNRMLKRHPQT